MVMKAVENDPSTYQNQNAVELFRSNLFRHECQELLSESHLQIFPDQKHAKKSVNELAASPKMSKWSSIVQKYISDIEKILYTSFSCKKSKSKDLLLLPIPDMKENNASSPPLYFKSDKYQKLGKDWKIPLPVIQNNGDDGNCNIHVKTVGSYINQSMTTKEANGYVWPIIDMAMIIGNPKTKELDSNEGFWMPKDYMNYRYLDKRNLLIHYIATIFRHKKNRKTIGSVDFSQMPSCPSKLTIILTPPSPSSSSQPAKKKKKDKHQFRVRILIGIPPDTFQSTRFFPNRNNLPAFSRKDTDYDDILHSGGTPYYNSCVLGADTMYDYILDNFSSTESSERFSPTSSLSEALILLKVWLAQRGMRNGHDTLNSAGLTLLMTYLLKKKVISMRMSSWEMIVIWLKFLSETDWLGDANSLDNQESNFGNEEDHNTIRHSRSTNDSLLRINQYLAKHKRLQKVLVMPGNNLGSGNNVLSETQTIANAAQSKLYFEMLSSERQQNKHCDIPTTLIEAFQRSTDGPIFLDSSLTCNFLSQCSASAMQEISLEARRTLYMIHHNEEKRHGIFSSIFCKTNRFWRKFDVYVKIPIDQLDEKKIWNSKGENYANEYDGIDKWKLKALDLGKRECITRGIISLLSMALGDRILCIRSLTSGNGEGSEFQNNSSQQEFKDTNTMDSDEIPVFSVSHGKEKIEELENDIKFGQQIIDEPPTTCLHNHIVLGLRLNPDTASRIVDRGPPVEDSSASSLFVSLWGKQLAQLRRFKDGAIVHAVVWKDVILSGGLKEYSNIETSGGIVEKIIQHIMQLHFMKKKASINFEMRNMLSLVEGLAIHQTSALNRRFNDSNDLHKAMMRAFDSLCDVLKQETTALGLPLAIDSVEPISSCLRYSSLFPPVPHPLLGGSKGGGEDSKISFMTPGEPILIQIRFEGSSKWPTDIDAMGAAKCAMLIKLASGIEETKIAGFSGPPVVYPGHLDVGFEGYSWRIIVRADQELRMLNELRKPSLEAIKLQQTLTKRHIISSLHHSSIHAVHTSHPSASSAVRLAQRWIAAHMLSGQISIEALELIVAESYINPYPFEVPGTAVSGFLRFLYTLGHFDWKREPFIVDPQRHLTSNEITQIRTEFESIRGSDYQNGPPMYIISPFDNVEFIGFSTKTKKSSTQDNDKKWIPTSTEFFPEMVILQRMSKLAQLSYRKLLHSLIKGNRKDEWSFVFQESAASMKSYSALLRVSSDVIVDKTCCSSSGSFSITKGKEGGFESPFMRSLKKRVSGPKQLKIKMYKNLNSVAKNSVLHGWQPVEEFVANLKEKFGSTAVFLHNEYSPSIVAMLWRPTAYNPHPFSVANAEYKRPVDMNVNEDSLLITNSDDILREVREMGEDLLVNTKILDDRSLKQVGNKRDGKRKAADITSDDDSDGSNE